MSPLVIWPSVLGLSAFAGGLYTYRRDLSATGTRGRAGVYALGPVLIAAALATFAGEHFTQAREFSQLVPSWLPMRLAITYLVGVCLLAAAVSFITRRWIQRSAALLALLFALFVLLLYLPNAISNPGVRIVWIFPFREGTYAVGAFCVFAGEVRLGRPSGGLALPLRLWTAAVVVFFGLQNVLYPQFSPGVPDQQPTSAWVPLPHLVAYLTGAVLVAMGVAMLFRRTAVTAITGVGVLMIGLATVLFAPDVMLAQGVPQRVTAINFVADTLLFAGMMFAIAKEVAAPEAAREASAIESSPVAGPPLRQR